MHQRIEQLLKRRDLTKLTSGRSYRLKTEVPLYSPDAPFHGICDAVLELEDGTYIPLEIKSGNASPHTGEIIQLCAYAGENSTSALKQSSVTQPKHLYRRLRPRTLNARSVNS